MSEKQKQAWKKYRDTHKEAERIYNQKYKQEHREEIRAASYKYYHDNPDYFRNWRFKRRFGITLDEYNILFEKQGGVCAICGRLPWGRYKRLCVDHDHDTGLVRGLLCHSCNHILGDAYDDIKTLQSAIQYLLDWFKDAIVKL